jgi:hypothetical protein
MTCAHVLGLLDAGPFADYPRRHLEAAWQHARECATCGPAMELATELTRGLVALPQPTVPPNMTANVLARIAALPVAPAEAPNEISTARRTFAAARSGPVWATAVGGLAASAALVVSVPPPADGGAVDAGAAAWASLGTGMVALPSMTAAGLGLAAALAIYGAGLLLSAGPSERPRSSIFAPKIGDRE